MLPNSMDLSTFLLLPLILPGTQVYGNRNPSPAPLFCKIHLYTSLCSSSDDYYSNDNSLL